MERMPNSLSPFGEPTDTYKPLLDEWNGYRVKMDTFEQIAEKNPNPKTYTPDILEENQRQLVEAKKNMQEEVSTESILAEAVMAVIPTTYGWIGESGAYTVVTLEHDDVVNRVDAVKEVTVDKQRKIIVRWAEDVTRRHPGNHNTNSKRIENKRSEFDNREKVKAKVQGIKDSIDDRRKCAGVIVEYFESVAGPDIGIQITEPIPLPKVVISFPDPVIKELADLHMAADGGDIEARDKLRNHPARAEYLAEIKIGLESQIRKIEHRLFLLSDDQSKEHGWLTDSLDRAKSTLAYIDSLIGGDNHPLENTWLGEIYEEIFCSEVS
ncbi:MAG: hypothetical protein NUV96_00555 [Candidatus Colwellbacteria bacterium]|nr:hypothetical protein [Candidatus Colwellbacteria bacterium]